MAGDRPLASTIFRIFRDFRWSILFHVPPRRPCGRRQRLLANDVVMSTILYFGWARDCAGVESEQIELAGAVTVDELWSELIRRHPGLAACRSSSRIAVNMRYVDDRALIERGSEVAIIPPVAGG
jgi:molybdopterin converting factor subunit 1